MVRNCQAEIKGIVFDAEDIIETFLIKEKLGNLSGINKRIRRLTCVIQDRRKIALDIEGISKKISKMISVMQSFRIQQLIVNDGYMQPLLDRQRDMRQEFATENERNLVGFEENVKKLVKYLVEEENIQVVSITGMDGLGKTTLARQIFNHEDVKNKFDALAWVCVSQEFTRISVWQTILRNLKPGEEEGKILKTTESTLHGELFQLLKTSNSLIVLDDIWKEEDWNLIKHIFPPEKGWKVLLTSRNENVAACGDITYINFKPECLSIEKSWILFQRIAFPRKYTSGKHFKLKGLDDLEENGLLEECVPQFLRLTLLRLDDLEEWIVEKDFMPILQTLWILNCDKLKELPDGLQFIYSLKNLTIWTTEEKWEERLSKGGEDYYKVQHIPSLNINRYD